MCRIRSPFVRVTQVLSQFEFALVSAGALGFL
jgi:hypothetical protein